jgi:hypothetical protein
VGGTFYQITAEANEDILNDAQAELKDVMNSFELIKK